MGHGVFSDTSAHTVYTCPTGKTAIVKDVRVTNHGTLSVSVLFEVVRSSTGYRLVNYQGVSSGQATGSTGAFIVLEPGDSLRFTATGTTPSYSCWVSGAELAGVAP